jgi:hypothetical protein
VTTSWVAAPLPDEEGRLDWAAIEAGPSILPGLVRDPSEPVAAFSADEWLLGALGGSGGRPITLHWHSRRVEVLARAREQSARTWPEALLLPFKRAAWLLINKPTPDLLLNAQQAKRRTYPAPASIRKFLYSWRPLAAWLASEGVTSLDAVTTDLLDLYSERLEKPHGRLSPRSADEVRGHIIDLWARGPFLPQPDRIEEPSWHENGRSRQAMARGEGENRTLVISPTTMTPLLAWVLAVMELAPDILAAGEEYVEVLGGYPAGSNTYKQYHRRQSDEPAIAVARQVLQTHYPAGTPLPGAKGWNTRDQVDFPSAYIAAVHGEGRIDSLHVRWAVQEDRPAWRDHLDYTIPLPMSVEPQGRIADKQWREHIDYREVPALIALLRTACLLAITYLSGMRGREARELKVGCGVAVPAEDGGANYGITGRIWKGMVGQDGRQDLVGREHAWGTLKSGYDATVIAERLRRLSRFRKDAESDYLFPAQGKPVANQTTGEWIVNFIAWANEQVEGLGLPEQLRIPDCVGGPVLLTRLRRTLAWHIRHRPNGHVALAVQYGHVNSQGELNLEQGEGYSGRKASGMAEVLDEETRSAVASATTALRDEIMAGGGVSGLGAKRALDIAKGTSMGKLSAREEKDLLKQKDRAVFFNPRAFALCINDPDKAACRIGLEPGPPLPHRCVGKRCPNIVRVDSTVVELSDEAKRLRSEAHFSPGPLSDRLETRAQEFEDDAKEHARTRRTLPPPAGEEVV